MKKYIKSIFTIVNVLLLTVNISAQKDYSDKLYWGDELKEPANSYLAEILGSDASGFYALRKKTKGGMLSADKPQKIYIEKYNEDMKLKKAQEIDLRYKKKKRDFEKMLFLNGQFYLMTSFNNKAHKANYLFVQSIRKKTLTLSKNFTKIAETPARDEYREGKFNFHISKDSSKVLVYSQLPDQRKSNEVFSISVFDNEFKRLWEKRIQLPYPDNKFLVKDYRVDNNGNVYILGLLYDGQSGLFKRNSSYQYVILAYTDEGEEEEEYNIDLKDKFITDLTFRVDKKGELICSGFYSDKGTFSMKGTYFFKLDPKTREISNENFKEFDFDFVTEYYSDRKKKRAEKDEKSGNDRRSVELFQYSLNYI